MESLRFEPPLLTLPEPTWLSVEATAGRITEAGFLLLERLELVADGDLSAVDFTIYLPPRVT